MPSLINFSQLDLLWMLIYRSLFIIYCQYLYDFISHLEEGLNFQLPPLPEAEVSPNLHLFAAGRPIHRLTDTFPTIFASLKPNFQLNLNIFATKVLCNLYQIITTFKFEEMTKQKKEK